MKKCNSEDKSFNLENTNKNLKNEADVNDEFEDVSTNEIFSFNIYFIMYGVILYYIFCVVFPFSPYSLTIYINNLVLIIIVTFFTIFSIYFLLSEYWSYEETDQKEDVLFKPLKYNDMIVELNEKIDSGILPDVGDLDFTKEFIEKEFLT